MANVNLFSGGTAVFKPLFCNDDVREWTPPVNGVEVDYTPPYNSHMAGHFAQGFYTFGFPVVPNLNNYAGHHWMQTALKKVSAVNDRIRLFWVPMRSYVTHMHFEVTRIDTTLSTVQVQVSAERCTWDAEAEDWVWAANAAFDTDVASLGTFGLGATQTVMSKMTALPSSFTTGVPSTFGLNIDQGDGSYGVVVVGLKITAGSSAQLKALWKGDFCAYLSAKVEAFGCPVQAG